MKISVIMASFLGEYPSSAKNRESKFIRSVNSFINQTHQDKELIIVSDGCDITKKLYQENFSNNPQIKCLQLNKQPLFSGVIRDSGIREATGDIISYLDTDDLYGKTHLQTISQQFTDDLDFVYYDDYLVTNKEITKFQLREVCIRWGSIGTSSISHRNNRKYYGLWSDGYSHDWIFICKMITNGFSYRKLHQTPQYVVCHYGPDKDF